MFFYFALVGVVAGISFIHINYSIPNCKLIIKKVNNVQLACIVLCVIGGLRNLSVGKDNYNYAMRFLQFEKGDLHLFDTSFHWIYNLWIYFIQNICKNEYFFNFCCAVVIYIMVYRFINKYSENQALSIVLFLTLGIFFNSMNQTRQQLAASVLLLGFQFSMEKKPIKVLVCCIIAIFIHNVAVFMLPIYMFFSLTKTVNKKTVTFFTVGAIVIAFLFQIFIILFTRIFTHYTNYLGAKDIYIGLVNISRIGDLVLSIIIQVLLILVIIGINLNDKDYTFACILACMNSLSILSAYLVMQATFMTRIKGILNYWTILAIPFIISKLLKKSRAAYVVTALLSLVYMAKLLMSDGDGVVPYLFFR